MHVSFFSGNALTIGMSIINKEKKENPRRVALDILLRVEKDKGYSNLLLDSKIKSGNLSRHDAAFLTNLVYGVLENQICLDFFISHFAKRSAAKIQPKILNILRLGAYQIIFLDKVPAPAAVGESVELAKGCGESFASGFINAVLREIARSSDSLPYPDKEKDLKRYLHVRYSCPQWLLSKWIAEYGKENAQGILMGLEARPKAVLRVNTLKITADELIEKLAADGITVKVLDYPKNALEADRLPDLRHNDAFQNGFFTVQNTASQLCCAAAGAKSGDSVIDICSAPGGKSFTLAFIMKNVGIIRSLELYENRLELINEGARRLGIDIIKTAQNDASKHNPELGIADLVLCDVPCSGLGVIGRKPEIRYKDPASFDELPELQYSILCEGASHVKSGGTLVYSTCTLSRAENDSVAQRFLNEHADYLSVRPDVLLPFISEKEEARAGTTLFPHVTHSDGFFICVMKKSEL